MHIPDGFISPKVYLPAYAVAGLLWSGTIHRLWKRLDDATIPSLAVTTALAFVLMMILIPLPGGTSAHVTGVALLAISFGIGNAFLAISLVLFLQMVLLGAGGITTLPVNALAIGLIGGATAVAVYRTIKGIQETVALFLAGWFSINIAALLVGLILGIQPALAHREDGTPLFFPFGISIAVPALIIPHLLIGIGEGILTVLVSRLLTRRGIGRSR